MPISSHRTRSPPRRRRGEKDLPIAQTHLAGQLEAALFCSQRLPRVDDFKDVAQVVEDARLLPWMFRALEEREDARLTRSPNSTDTSRRSAIG